MDQFVGKRVLEKEAACARGECGCSLVSDGGPKPWRVKFRAPSFAALQATATCARDCLIADLIAVAASLDPVMGDVDR